MALRIVEEAGLTDVGRQRHTNEDRYFEAAPLFAVADGMGGARAGEVASQIAVDEFASARHVRIEPRRDGVWAHDLGSTNGTYVNGIRIDRPRKLVQGDLIRVGETELRFEE